MKKVIIITRDGEYPANCNAYKQYSTSSSESFKQNIHSYIKDIIMEIFGNDDQKYAHERWDPLTRKDILPSYDQMYVDDTYEKLHQESNTTDEFYKWLENEILKKISDAIAPKDTQTKDKADNKPYVYFQYNNVDVYFVFLNRIFDTLLYGSEEYGALVDDEHRLKFIEAICTDCGISKGVQEKAILYIHDKEWYKSDISYSVLLKGKYKNDEGLNNTIKEELANYFSTIKVFLHNENHIFNEIKALNFTEDDEELAILEREYW